MEKKPPAKIRIGRYIDPLSDFGFKRLFGSEPNKDLLIDFLNELFRGRKSVLDLVYNKNEQPGPQPGFRKSIFDLTCTDGNGAKFIVEVQRVYQHFFKDRAIFYTSSLIHEQGPKGENGWDFRLQEVYLIALMEFGFGDSLPGSYLHRVYLTDEATGKVFYEKLGYIFIEIPKFTMAVKDLKTGLDRWLYLLKNLSRLKKIPVFLDKRIFQKLFNIAEVSKLTKEEYMRYEKSLMAKWDEYAILKTAREEGMEKGIEKGIEKGMEKKSFEMVKNLLAAGSFTIPQIANFAGVTEAFIKKVRREIKK
jgi:predicted transposase/invertase (TIGR01784 family)